MTDLAAMQARIAEIQRQEADRRVSREAAASANRARVSAWSPAFGRMCDQLRELGMWGRMVKLEIPQ